MTPQQHNKYLGLAHIGYAVLQSLFIVALCVFIYLMFESALPSIPGFTSEFLFWRLILTVVFFSGWTVPSLVAGYALLKHKSWAKTCGIIAAALAATSAPFGVAVSIYTFWFLLGEGGKEIYDQRERLGAGEYAPPRQMPNWRD